MTTKELARLIDHTILRTDASYADIDKCCQEALAQNFYSVCINPQFVKRGFEHLKGSTTSVCTVIGFPLGANLPEVKAFEAGRAIQDGASELDMVLNVSALKSGDDKLVLEDIRGVVNAAQGRVVKLILETHLLTEEEKIRACLLANEAKAHFVKTSTGMGGGGATVEDVALMKKHSGHRLAVKASGGIRDLVTLKTMISAGASRIGTSQGLKILAGLEISKGAY